MIYICLSICLVKPKSETSAKKRGEKREEEGNKSTLNSKNGQTILSQKISVVFKNM